MVAKILGLNINYSRLEGMGRRRPQLTIMSSQMPFLFETKLDELALQGCFFQQFFKSVGKAGYLALRNGFITSSPCSGKPVLWTMFVVFLLINVYCELVHGWSYIVGTVVVPTNQVSLLTP
ncbi:Mlo3 [Cucumis melo var. makuwa]|uniref:Mlo3 n=1 Tax=Cucumis melo var. makuwa TaxID=1194695 RepID=A0A5D3E6S9_CUCMM|nr:Mlo3 [Cucumis melo var. makuwa]TYK31356.1 Mlo3 [Cucumis melo var. makuwa]